MQQTTTERDGTRAPIRATAEHVGSGGSATPDDGLGEVSP